MSGPLIIQSNKTILLETSHELADEARAAIAPFTELESAPEHIHTYNITALALWNARASSMDAEQIIDALIRFAKFPPPQSLLVDIVDTIGRYGRLRIENHPTQGLVLTTSDVAVLHEVSRNKTIAPMLGAKIDDDTWCIHNSERGRIKQALIKIGWPAEDTAGYIDGQAHPITLEEHGWNLRPYQLQAAQAFHAGGSGVVVMPCGSGKTIVGATVMSLVSATTLILVTNTISARQWKDELIARTSLTADEIGEYSGERKEIRPVTIATYSVITRKKKNEYAHLELFNARDWGLIIYDEVHLLPAPVFRLTADLQSRRRLGLTATLVREDGKEKEVFSLIGPKKFDVPWKEMENQGWIATAVCEEIRVQLAESTRMRYAVADGDQRYQLCASASEKTPIIEALLHKHRGENILIIGAFIDQLETLSNQLDVPLVQGSTTSKQREKIFQQYRTGEISTLIVSKVANFSLDLPEAAIIIQISGTYGSRQEEAQRLGRVLRPKHDNRQAHFYSIVARDTIDASYAQYRQRFLSEQGYSYTIVDGAEYLSS